MPHKEINGTEIRKLRGPGVVVFALRSAKGVFMFGIVVNCDERIGIKCLVDHRLSFRRTKTISTGDVQHQGTFQILCLSKCLLDADTVVTNRAVRIEPHGEQIGEISTETKPDGTYSRSAGRMFAQKLHCRRRVCNSRYLVEAGIQRKGFLPFGFGLVSQLNAAFLPPKKIWTECHKAALSIPVS